MLKKILLSFGFIVALHVLAPSSAAASCGGPGEVPCYHWDWCAYTTPSIFGDVCWGGLVPDTVCGGCDCDRRRC